MPKVSVFDRNSADATDTASTESVMLEFLQSNTMPNISNQDNFVLIQATSPLLTNKMLDDMLNLFAVSGNIFVYEMPGYMGSEIDKPEDWIIMEKLFF